MRPSRIPAVLSNAPPSSPGEQQTVPLVTAWRGCHDELGAIAGEVATPRESEDPSADTASNGGDDRASTAASRSPRARGAAWRRRRSPWTASFVAAMRQGTVNNGGSSLAGPRPRPHHPVGLHPAFAATGAASRSHTPGRPRPRRRQSRTFAATSAAPLLPHRPTHRHPRSRSAFACPKCRLHSRRASYTARMCRGGVASSRAPPPSGVTIRRGICTEPAGGRRLRLSCVFLCASPRIRRPNSLLFTNLRSAGCACPQRPDSVSAFTSYCSVAARWPGAAIQQHLQISASGVQFPLLAAILVQQRTP